MSAIDVFNTKSRTAARTGIFATLKERFARYQTYHNTLEELEALSDRELADLGVSRTMLRGIAYRAAYEG